MRLQGLLLAALTLLGGATMAKAANDSGAGLKYYPLVSGSANIDGLSVAPATVTVTTCLQVDNTDGTVMLKSGPGCTNNVLSILYSSFTTQSYQGNTAGGENIFKSTAGPALVIISSAGTVPNTDGDTVVFVHQLSADWNGVGVLRIEDDNLGYSGPTIRMGARNVNVEWVSSSTDTAHCKGSFEQAIAVGGAVFQSNNRSYDCSTYENGWQTVPLDMHNSGIQLKTQNVGVDGGLWTSSDTSGIDFFDLDGHTVGLTGPANANASYRFGLPSTVGAQGEFMFHNGNRGINENVRQMEWSNSNDTYSRTTGLSVASATVQATLNISGFSRKVITVTGNFTLTSTHSIVNTNCQAPCVITLPAASALGAGISQELILNNVSGSSATVTITRAGSDLINSTNSFASNAGIDRIAWLNSDGASNWTGPVAFAPMMSPFRADSNTGQTMLSSGIVHMMVRVDAPGCLLGIRTVGYSSATSNNVVAVYAVEGGSSTVLLAASTQAHTNYNAIDHVFTYTISTPSVTAAQTTCLPIPGGTTIAVAIMDTDGFDAMPRCSAPISNGNVPFQGMLYDATSRTAATNSVPLRAGILTEANARCYPFGFLWAGGLTQ